MQKDFDRKALEQRIVLLQKNVQSGRALIEEKKQDLEKSTRDVADKDAQLAKLAEEISTHEGHLQACTASLAAAEKLLHPPVASPPAAAAPEKSRYLRFSNRECTLVSGKGAPQSWRDCVEDAKGKSR
jgi:Tfp pilus assembly protein FimV